MSEGDRALGLPTISSLTQLVVSCLPWQLDSKDALAPCRVSLSLYCNITPPLLPYHSLLSPCIPIYRAFSANSWTLDLLANEALLAALTGVELNGRLASSSLGDGAGGTSVHDGTVYSSTLYGAYGYGAGAPGGGGGGGGPEAAASTNVAELAGMLGSGDWMGIGAAAASVGAVTPGPSGTGVAIRAASGAQAGRAGSGSSAAGGGAGLTAEGAGAEGGTAAAAVVAGSAGAAASARAVAAAAVLRRLYSGIAAAGRTGSASQDATVHAASQAAAALLAAANAAAAAAAAAPSSTPPTAAAHLAGSSFTRRISEASSSGPASVASGSLALPGMLSEGADGRRRASIGLQQQAAGSIPRAAAALAAALGTRAALGSGAGGGGPARLRPSGMSFGTVRIAHVAPSSDPGVAGLGLGTGGTGRAFGVGGGSMPTRPIRTSTPGGPPSEDMPGQGGASAPGPTWMQAARARPSWTGASPMPHGSGGLNSPFTTGHGHRHSFSTLAQLGQGSGAAGPPPQTEADTDALGAGWSPSVVPALQQQRSRLLSGAGSVRLMPESSEAISTVRDGDGYLNITLQRAPSFGAAWRRPSGAMGTPDVLAGLGSVADRLGYGSVGTPAEAAGLSASPGADAAAGLEPLPLVNTRRLLLQQEVEGHTEPNSPAASVPWGAPRGAPGRRRRGVAAFPAAAMAAVTAAAATIAAPSAADGSLPSTDSSTHGAAVPYPPGSHPPCTYAGTGLVAGGRAAAGTAAPLTVGLSGTGASGAAAGMGAAAGGATAPIRVPFTSSQWRWASHEAAAHTTRRISTEYSVSPASLTPTPALGATRMPHRSPRPSRGADSDTDADTADASARRGHRQSPGMGFGALLLEGTDQGTEEDAGAYAVTNGYTALGQDPQQDGFPDGFQDRSQDGYQGGYPGRYRDGYQDPMLTFSPTTYFHAGSLAAVAELDEQRPLPLRAFLAPRPSMSLALPHADEVIAAERAALEETLHGGNLWLMEVVGGRRAAPAGSAAAVAAAAMAAARSGALSCISGGLSGAMSGGADRSFAPVGAPGAGAEQHTAHTAAAPAASGNAALGITERHTTHSRQRMHANTPPGAMAAAEPAVAVYEALDLPPTWPLASIAPAAVRPTALSSSRPRAIPVNGKHEFNVPGAAPLHTRAAVTAHVPAAASAHHSNGVPLHAPAPDSPPGMRIGTHHMLLDGSASGGGSGGSGGGGGGGGGGGSRSYGSSGAAVPDSPRAVVPRSIRTHERSPMRAMRRRPAATPAGSGEQRGDSSAHSESKHGDGDSAHRGSMQEGAALAGQPLTEPRRGPHMSHGSFTMLRPTAAQREAGAAPRPQPRLSPPAMHRWRSPFEAAATEALPEWDGTSASAAAGRRPAAEARAAQSPAAVVTTARLAVTQAGAHASSVAPAMGAARHQPAAMGHVQAERVCGSPTRWHSPFEAYAAAPIPAAALPDDVLRRPQRRG